MRMKSEHEYAMTLLTQTVQAVDDSATARFQGLEQGFESLGAKLDHTVTCIDAKMDKQFNQLMAALQPKGGVKREGENGWEPGGSKKVNKG